MFLLKASAEAKAQGGFSMKERVPMREREIKGRQESEVAQWMMACSGTRWALMCAA